MCLITCQRLWFVSPFLISTIIMIGWGTDDVFVLICVGCFFFLSPHFASSEVKLIISLFFLIDWLQHQRPFYSPPHASLGLTIRRFSSRHIYIHYFVTYSQQICNYFCICKQRPSFQLQRYCYRRNSTWRILFYSVPPPWPVAREATHSQSYL